MLKRAMLQARSTPQYKKVYRTLVISSTDPEVRSEEVEQVVTYVCNDGETWVLQSVADVSRPRFIKR